MAAPHRSDPVVENFVALSYKVHVRRLEDFAPLKQELQHAIGAAALILHLKAYICRHDLLVHIEAVGE
jgi:hypothetical protein